MECYNIMLGSNKVGIVSIETVGLYTRFWCRCAFPDEGFYRVLAQYSEITVDLGICVPNDDEYVTQAKIPSKGLGKGIPRFYAVDRSKADIKFVPLKEGECLGCIDRLPDATLSIHKNEKRLVFPND